MASDVNLACLTGRLTADPDLRATQAGSSVLRFSLAVNRTVRGADGRWEEVADYVDCVVLGARADGLQRYLARGMRVCVSGALRQARWTAQDGSKRSKVELLASSVVLPDRRAQGGGAAASIAYDQATAQGGHDAMADADIPF